MASLLNVKIQGPEAIMWQGQAQSVSSTNSEGEFDILPGHANMITLVKKHPLRLVDAQSKPLKLALEQVVIYVRNNFVSIYSF